MRSKSDVAPQHWPITAGASCRYLPPCTCAPKHTACSISRASSVASSGAARYTATRFTAARFTVARYTVARYTAACYIAACYTATCLPCFCCQGAAADSACLAAARRVSAYSATTCFAADH